MEAGAANRTCHLSEQAEGSTCILGTLLCCLVLGKAICSQKKKNKYYNSVAEARCLFLVTLAHAITFSYFPKIDAFSGLGFLKS